MFGFSKNAPDTLESLASFLRAHGYRSEYKKEGDQEACILAHPDRPHFIVSRTLFGVSVTISLAISLPKLTEQKCVFLTAMNQANLNMSTLAFSWSGGDNVVGSYLLPIGSQDAMFEMFVKAFDFDLQSLIHSPMSQFLL